VIVSGEWLLHADSRHPRPLHNSQYFPTGLSPAFALNLTDVAARATRFYRWHIDTALYDLCPPCVMTLYALRVPRGLPQVCRYDDGTGDALSVPLGTTAFVSGKTVQARLPPELKSVAVHACIMYAPHPYV
jgi:hypothetical protein